MSKDKFTRVQYEDLCVSAQDEANESGIETCLAWYCYWAGGGDEKSKLVVALPSEYDPSDIERRFQPQVKAAIPIRRLPDFAGVAKDISELFGPDECKSGEVIVRYGRIESGSYGVIESIASHCQDKGVFSLVLYIREQGEWKFEMGGNNAESLRAIRQTISEIGVQR